eukprot:Plantae.Rhodophyta-Purpureofilum_apyrenoidigerum.ctg18143.p1 GENE.Plantae.Rhodophyta-Purpureofilum_apyrenoidigerum.ctg18143~~Plantae.Rhodophyta-Purpureofilum_apyrenoidigerum.ctg18143.p1  ORF type:complete len:163 (+),score=44.70 Plantae.Rhodophyta-Purpureofilum_apyrenoidigerum.ctg18143:70-558(+)
MQANLRERDDMIAFVPSLLGTHRVCRAPAAVRSSRRTVVCVSSVKFERGTINEIASLEEFDKMLEEADGDLAVVEFYAKWCKKCISMVKRYKKLSMEFEASLCGKVDINVVGKLPRRQNIREMPTFQFFKKGEKVGEIIGRLDSDGVEKQMREYFETYAVRT